MLDNLKISTRLMLLTGSLLVLLTIVGFMGLRGVSGTSEGLRSVYENNTVPLVQLGEVLDVVYQSRAQVITGMGADSSSAADVHFQEVEKVNKQLSQIWGDFRSAVTSEEGKTQAAIFEQAWKDYAESGNKTIELARSGDYETASSFMKTESAKKFAAARDALLNLMKHEKETAKNSFESASKSNTTTKTVVLITLLLGLAIGAGQSYGTIRSIASRLNLMQTTIGEVEQSSDFSKRVPIDSSDEVGQTAKSFNELMGVLQHSFGVIQDNVTQVSGAAHRLSAVADQVASSSEQGSDDSAEMAATVEEVTVSINHISESAREALSISRKSGELSIEGGKIIHEAASEMTKIADTVRRTSQTIEELGQHSNDISAIVQVIKDVADQTNLLALNAAIEAARAGEQGRGFAVVADEVRKLAERTTKATEEITQMIGAIQGSAHAAVAAMSGTVSMVDGGVSLAHQAGDAINQIRDGAHQVTQVVNDISVALVEQSAASNNLAGHVEKVAQITERNSAAAGESAKEAQHMDELAGSMRETVSRFRI
ncbi:methyl-accepting chemotaxis protein [Sulfurimicrobium lacus]|uniref:Methyl-accepting chemotaxis protein n=1 Tax=Sulfurimicrobium lacus TaxID=2715678 RepID=A0A6F8VBA4_9PROT|nr:methyl-accepting chemotaxis protein [Sulfurimicrobium lacus]BCB26431.1 methyl-accepting chemotaxis protein [Sulfurimicrobium lacus]